MRSTKKILKRVGISALVLAQIATAGFVMPTTAGAFAASAITRSMENLDRGVVAIMTENGVYLSWRRLGTEPENTNFEVYRNKEKITEGAITNYTDAGGDINDFYTIVCNGTMSKSVPVLNDNYIEIPMAEAPDYEGGFTTSRQGVGFGFYRPGDGTYGDLDGDGEYEVIVLWNPTDAKDAASGGRTGKAYVDAYKLDGTFMWRIDMGWNIRAGAHDTMLCVADFNGDGCAEMMLRTSDGTIDGVGNIIGNPAQAGAYEDSWAAKNGGKALQAPLYVTAFDGKTGAALDSQPYYPNNVEGSTEVSLSFGDDFGNRSERYNATIAYVDGKKPSTVFGRGYYFGKNGRQRQGACCYSLGADNKLKLEWVFDTEPGAVGYEKGNEIYVGQGNHQIEAADVDGDGKDEVSTGALWYDDNGKILWSSQLEHGDVIHVGDFDPRNPGLETFTAKEDYSDSSDRFDYKNQILSGMKVSEAIGADNELGRVKWGIHLQDAKTGRFLQTWNGTKDTGRGVIANIGYGDSYYVMWGAGGTGYHDMNGTVLTDLSLSMNGRIYWDGDLQDELQDHYGANDKIRIDKWDDKQKKRIELFAPEGSHSINSTKGNTSGQGDMIGDWREEFVSFVETGKTETEEEVILKGSFDVDIPAKVTKTKYSFALRLYTTTIPTKYNFYTLAHDDIYRNSSGAYNNCYNQPPHISWYMNDFIEGSTYTTQPAANISLVNNSYTAPSFDASKLPEKGSGRTWTPGESSGTGAADAAAGATGGTTGISDAAEIGATAGLGLFTDCINHWSKDNINYLAGKGIVNGVTETEFYPDNTVTKGEFLKMAVTAAGYSAGNATNGTHWATPYYAAALKAGMLPAGLNLKSSQLDELIDREEMATLVCATAKAKGKSINSTAVTFADANQISGALAEYVNGAANMKIINGYEDGSFKPQGTATRAEAAAMLARLVSQL
ncbi:MAG: S-layer homology domain-containing protein [Clostridia bacterium]|nr:S-layer homology domain-containing protein [Clostridia bacterium]